MVASRSAGGDFTITLGDGNDRIALTPTTLTVNGGVFDLTGVTSVSVVGGKGSDEFLVEAYPVNIPVTLDGGDGSDTLIDGTPLITITSPLTAMSRVVTGFETVKGNATPATSPRVAILDVVDGSSATTASYVITGGADQSLFAMNTAGFLSFTTVPVAGVPVDADGDGVYVVSVSATDGAVSFATELRITVADLPPTSVDLLNVVSAIPENVDTSSRVKVADIRILDQGQGTNSIALQGPAAGLFETEGGEQPPAGGGIYRTAALYLKQGTAPAVTTAEEQVVIVVQSSLPGSQAVATTYAFSVVDAFNDPPQSISLVPVVTSLSENTDTSSAVRLAEISIDDDPLGTITFALSGDNASAFQIVATSRSTADLYLKAGAILDFETQPALAVSVSARDLTLPGTPALTADYTLAVTDEPNAAPTAVAFANSITSLAETADTAKPVRLADILLSDDREGTNVLSLTGTDAADFEIIDGVLYLKKGVVLDYETRNCRVVTVAVTDASVSATPSATREFVLQVTQANDSPTSVSLVGAVTSLPESTSTAVRIKLADIVVTDTEANPVRNAINSVLNVDRIPAQSARYVKFSILATSNGSQPCIDELEVYATDGRNVALAAVPYASGTLPGYAAHALSHINDGLTGNSHSWISDTTDTGWVVLDLRDVATIDKVVWSRDRSGAFPDDRVATSYRIEFSSDGITWQTVASEWDRLPFGSGQSVTNDMLATPPGGGQLPSAANTISLSGTNADLLEVVGQAVYLKAGVLLNHEAQPQITATVNVVDETVPRAASVTADYELSVTDVAEPPAGVTLTDVVPSLTENTDTTQAIQLATIVVADEDGGIVVADEDGGPNEITLVGVDAAVFEVVGTRLVLRAGTALDFEAKPFYAVTIRVADPTVAGSTAVSVDYRLDLIDTNAAPTISLINAVTTLPESTSTASRTRVADLVISDDGEGTNTISLAGDDREDFEIEAGSLYLKAGTELDYDTGPSRSLSVVVADALLVGVPASRASYTLTISDVNERPTSVSLANAKASLPENTNTAVAIKVADILIVDQDAGANTVTLAGPNAVSFQVVGAALYLRAGAVLSAGLPPLAVTVRVADATASDTTPVSVDSTLTITAAAQGPTASFATAVPPVDAVALSFSRSVTGVDRGDFSLIRDGQPVSLATATLAGSGTSYTLSGLASLTAYPGNYELSLMASGSGILDANRIPYADNSSVAWTVEGVVNVPAGETQTDTTVRTGNTIIVKRGAGTLILDQANSHSGGTVVEAGEVIVRNPLALGSGGVVVQAGAKLTLDTAGQQVSINGLGLDTTSALDLGTSSVLITDETYLDNAGIISRIARGVDELTGIISSSIEPGTFREIGHQILPDGSLKVGYSAVGDANMDGSVNVQDLIAISTSGKYGSGLADAGWWQGDFNHDGVVNITDLINLSTSGLYGTGSYMPPESSGSSALVVTSSTPTLAANTLPDDLQSATTAGTGQPEPEGTDETSLTTASMGATSVTKLAWTAIATEQESKPAAPKNSWLWGVIGQ